MAETPDFQPGRRICVVGNSGSGKTYVARKLAGLLGVTYISNDLIFWGPDWTPAPLEQRLAEYARAARGEAWTFDGNVDGQTNKGDSLLQRTDTIVWLDLPRWRIFTQALGRTCNRAWTKEPMWHNNTESWRMSYFSRDSILLLTMKSYARRKKRNQALFSDPAHAHIKKLRLTRRGQINAWLASVERGLTR